MSRSNHADHVSEVFPRLTKLGAPCLTRTSKDTILKAVEACQPVRKEHVASRSGWAGSVYVLADGTTVPSEPKPPLIIGLTPDRTQEPKGSLEGWQEGVGPIVQGQTIPLFLLGVAFCALLRRLTPPDYHNVLVELVGDGAAGKTILSSLASSVFRGNPEGDTGGGASWDRTQLSVDESKITGRDSLVVFDEAQLAGRTEQERNTNVQQTVFRMFGTGARSRVGDLGPPEHSRVAFLSTSNTPLSEMVSGNQLLKDAALSRIITVTIDPARPYGALDALPKGFKDSAEAMEGLRSAVDLNYGWPARAFLERLIKEIAEDEAAFKAKLKRDLASFRSDCRAKASSAVRAEKSFALIAVAGRLARKWGVIPKHWGSVSKACLRIQRTLVEVPPPRGKSAQSRIQEYVSHNKDRIKKISSSDNPDLAITEYENAAGFLIGSGQDMEFIMSTKMYRTIFDGDEMLLRLLRELGLMKTEIGKDAKLSTKTPRKICASGRSYRFRIGRFC